ncbi:MAG: DUF951 domain-containing protein [Bacilli bacterium]
MINKEYKLNSIVEMKKIHPCGNNKWIVLRLGVDIKIKCLKCERIIMISRQEFSKKIKKVVTF